MVCGRHNYPGIHSLTHIQEPTGLVELTPARKTVVLIPPSGLGIVQVLLIWLVQCLYLARIWKCGSSLFVFTLTFAFINITQVSRKIVMDARVNALILVSSFQLSSPCITRIDSESGWNCCHRHYRIWHWNCIHFWTVSTLAKGSDWYIWFFSVTPSANLHRGLSTASFRVGPSPSQGRYILLLRYKYSGRYS